MDNKLVPKSVEDLKNCIETQLIRMQSLSLEESRLQSENSLYQEMYSENAKKLEHQKTSLRQIASNIYDRRDNFCKSVYKTITDIQQGYATTPDPIVESEKQLIKDELEKVDVQIVQLRRLNAMVNMEMIVIKAELARAKDDQQRVYEVRAEQEQIKEQISQLQLEVQQLEIDVAASNEPKRANVEDILTISPWPKRPYISDSVPPNSPNFSSDEESATLEKSRAVGFDFSECFDGAKGTSQKSKFVFKRAVQQGSLFDPGTSEFSKK